MTRALLVGLSALALTAGAAQAADLYIPTTPQPIVESAGFDWEGMYAGVHAGALFYPDEETSEIGPLAVVGSDYGTLGIVGLHLGVNSLISSNMLLGVEGTAEYLFDDYYDYAQFMLNGRVGFLATESLLLYALAGVGVEYSFYWEDTRGIYQLGVGAELAVADNISLRGQVAGIGLFDSDDLFDGTKATIGISFHF